MGFGQCSHVKLKTFIIKISQYSFRARILSSQYFFTTSANLAHLLTPPFRPADFSCVSARYDQRYHECRCIQRCHDIPSLACHLFQGDLLQQRSLWNMTDKTWRDCSSPRAGTVWSSGIFALASLSSFWKLWIILYLGNHLKLDSNISQYAVGPKWLRMKWSQFCINL